MNQTAEPNDWKQAPIYRQTAAYAREHNELAAYRASMGANIACRDAIDQAISKHFDGMHLNQAAVQTVLEAFGEERTLYVLANTVQYKDWDGRFSRENRAWANAMAIPSETDVDGNRRSSFVVNSHPAVLDGYIHMVRKESRLAQRDHAQSIHEKLQKPSRPSPAKHAKSHQEMER